MTIRSITRSDKSRFQKTKPIKPKIIHTELINHFDHTFYLCTKPEHHQWMYNRVCHLIKEYSPIERQEEFQVMSMYEIEKVDFIYSMGVYVYDDWRNEMFKRNINSDKVNHKWYSIALVRDKGYEVRETYGWQQRFEYKLCRTCGMEYYHYPDVWGYICFNCENPNLLNLVNRLKKIRLKNLFIRQWMKFINLPETIEWFYQPEGIGYKWANRRFNQKSINF